MSQDEEMRDFFFLLLREATGVRHAREEIGRCQHTGVSTTTGNRDADHLEIPDRDIRVLHTEDLFLASLTPAIHCSHSQIWEKQMLPPWHCPLKTLIFPIRFECSIGGTEKSRP